MLNNFNNPVEFVNSLNDQIWNQKQIGTIYDCFKHNVLVHVYGRTIYGRDQVMEDVIDLLAGFPDMERKSDQFIWALDGKNGYYVSERWSWTAHAKGYTVYGAPSGKKVSCFGITNYYIYNGYVVEMWYTEDSISIPGQLQIEEEEAIKLLLDLNVYPSYSGVTSGENVRLQGEFPPEEFGENNGRFRDVEYLVRMNVYNIYNRRMLGTINDYLRQEFVYHGPNGREIIKDRELYIQDRLSVLQAFPDLSLQVHDFYAIFDTEREQQYVAYRWTMTGTHGGKGVYRKAAGKRIYLPGITHLVLEDDKVLEQWTSFDELALKCELYAAVNMRKKQEEQETQGIKQDFENGISGGQNGE